jgi:hypothetical protein
VAKKREEKRAGKSHHVVENKYKKMSVFGLAKVFMKINKL